MRFGSANGRSRKGLGLRLVHWGNGTELEIRLGHAGRASALVLSGGLQELNPPTEPRQGLVGRRGGLGRRVSPQPLPVDAKGVLRLRLPANALATVSAGPG